MKRKFSSSLASGAAHLCMDGELEIKVGPMSLLQRQPKAEMSPHACLAAGWKQSKAAPLPGRKKPHCQKAKERVPQGYLLSQSPVCCPHSGLNHDGGYSPIQASSWLSPFCFKAAGKHSPRAPPSPLLQAAGGQLHTASQELKKTKTSLKFKRGKRLVCKILSSTPNMKQAFSYLRPHDLGGTFKKF